MVLGITATIELNSNMRDTGCNGVLQPAVIQLDGVVFTDQFEYEIL